MNANWGLVDPPARRIRNRKAKRKKLARRAMDDFRRWMADVGIGRARTSGDTGVLAPWHAVRPPPAPKASLA